MLQTITNRKNFGIAKTSQHFDVKFLSVDDQRRFMNMYTGILSEQRFLPPVIRTRDEQHIPLSIWVGTFNLSNNKPPDALHPWMPQSGYDVCAIGYQSCQEFDGFEWLPHLRENLGPEMIAIGAYEAGSLRCCVAVHKKHLHAVTHVECERFAVGVGHVAFDKGITSVILRIRLILTAT